MTLNRAIKKKKKALPHLAGSIGKRLVGALNGHSGVKKFGEMAKPHGLTPGGLCSCWWEIQEHLCAMARDVNGGHSLL